DGDHRGLARQTGPLVARWEPAVLFLQSRRLGLHLDAAAESSHETASGRAPAHLSSARCPAHGSGLSQLRVFAGPRQRGLPAARAYWKYLDGETGHAAVKFLIEQ